MAQLAALTETLDTLTIYVGGGATLGSVSGFAVALCRWWITLVRPAVLNWSGWGAGFGGIAGLVLYVVTV